MKRLLIVVFLILVFALSSTLPALAEEPLYTISGRVFLDDNCNCTCDSGEGPLVADMQFVVAGRYRAVVQEDGRYSLQLPPGTYRIRVVMENRWQFIPTTQRFVVLDIPSDVAEIDFGFRVCAWGKVPRPFLGWTPGQSVPIGK